MGLGSEIPDLGVKKAPDPGSGSATLPGINAMHLTNEHSILGSVHQIRIPTSLPKR